MKHGKITGTILKRSVVNLLEKGPRTCVDAAVLKVPSEGQMLFSESCGDLSKPYGAEFAVYRAANNIFAAGGKLRGIMACFFVSEETEERQLKELTRQVLFSCGKLETELIGGHTQVVAGGSFISITAIGEKVFDTDLRFVKPEMDIVETKWIALESVAGIVACEDRRLELCGRYDKEYIKPAMEYHKWMSVCHEAELCAENGAVFMHDVSGGGIFTALWELSEGSKCGISVDLREIPVLQETIEITDFFGRNPYKEDSMGSLLAVCSDGKKLVRALDEAGIPAALIGRTKSGNDKILTNDGEIRYLEKI